MAALREDFRLRLRPIGLLLLAAVNKKFADKMSATHPSACLKSLPPGPEPPAACVKHACASGPYTIRYWPLLGPERLVESRMRACLEETTHAMEAEDFASWLDYYIRKLDPIMRESGKGDSPLDRAIAEALPCKPLAAWQRRQDKWVDIQSEASSRIRVHADAIEDDYSLDDLYPPLIRYGKVFRECGQETSRKGTIFWGDFRAEFRIESDGAVDPASIKATYPATAYMQRFIDCTNSAFKALRFSPPHRSRPVHAGVRIHIPFSS